MMRKWRIVLFMGYLLALSVGGFFLAHSKVENNWFKVNNMIDSADEWGSFQLREEVLAGDKVQLSTLGIVDHINNQKYYDASTSTTDESNFKFNVYMAPDKVYLFSGDQWYQADYTYPPIHELESVNHPFYFWQDVLKYVDHGAVYRYPIDSDEQVIAFQLKKEVPLEHVGLPFDEMASGQLLVAFEPQTRQLRRLQLNMHLSEDKTRGYDTVKYQVTLDKVNRATLPRLPEAAKDGKRLE